MKKNQGPEQGLQIKSRYLVQKIVLVPYILQDPFR
jgi:hypothetical protein